MSTEALLKLLIGIVTGTLIPAASAVVLLVWKASRDWTTAGAHIENLAREVKQLVERIDVMNGQLDSVRLWRERHQATSDAQIERLDQIAKEVSR
jgi:uncharacterized protein (DUF3084 family)